MQGSWPPGSLTTCSSSFNPTRCAIIGCLGSCHVTSPTPSRHLLAPGILFSDVLSARSACRPGCQARARQHQGGGRPASTRRCSCKATAGQAGQDHMVRDATTGWPACCWRLRLHRRPGKSAAGSSCCALVLSDISLSGLAGQGRLSRQEHMSSTAGTSTGANCQVRASWTAVLSSRPAGKEAVAWAACASSKTTVLHGACTVQQSPLAPRPLHRHSAHVACPTRLAAGRCTCVSSDAPPLS